MRRVLALVLAAAAAAALAGCGGAAPPATTGTGTDRAFVAEMVPHHASAIDMARTGVARSRSTVVRGLAEHIARTQAAEIAAMRAEDRRLAADGVARGDLGVAGHAMGMDGDVAALRTARDPDVAFLRMMLPHHEGALAMARAELARGGDPVLRRMARAIVAGQQREIALMRALLARSA